MEERDLLTSCRARTRSIPKLVLGEAGEALIEFGAKKKEARNTKTSEEIETEESGERGRARKARQRNGAKQWAAPPFPLPLLCCF